MAEIDVAKKLQAQAQQLALETRELDLLIESTTTEVNRLKARETQSSAKVVDMQKNPANFQRDEIFGAYREFAEAMEKRVTMEGQLTALQSKRKLMDRVNPLLVEAVSAARELPAPSTNGSGPAPLDESKLLQAVVET